MNRGIEQKGVQGTVARHFYKANQPPLLTRGDMEQAGVKALLKTQGR
jgi:hypothetical protein